MPILQIRKLRRWNVNYFAWGHTAKVEFQNLLQSWCPFFWPKLCRMNPPKPFSMPFRTPQIKKSFYRFIKDLFLK